MNGLYHIGIDPGVSGGIAVSYPDNSIKLYNMPDPYTDIVDLLREFPNAQTVVYLEQINGFMGGKLPASRIGVLMENYGFLQGALRALGLSTARVIPSKWQAGLGAGTRSKSISRQDWKNKIKRIVSERHPTLKVTLATSDALGILDYLLNTMDTKTHGTPRLSEARSATPTADTAE